MDIREALIGFGAKAEAVQAFLDYHCEHPDVWKRFEEFSLNAIDAGRNTYGAMAIFNRIRWHVEIELKCAEWKINNNFAPLYARVFLLKYPQHSGFFKCRALGEEND
jgi:hypothetical protein